MSKKPLSIKFMDGNRHRLFKVIGLAALISSYSVNATLAQDADLTADEFHKLYDCEAYYSITNSCYSSDKSDESHRLAVTASDNRDKVFHLLFISITKAGILPETSMADMKSSTVKMLLLFAGNCKKVFDVQPTLGLSCDKIIDNVPKQHYDKGKKSGSLKGFVPTAIG